MTTGEKLSKLRKENEYTQEELAEIMSVSRQSISKWESDVAFPETEKLVTLSKLYHCSIDYLLNDSLDEDIKKGRSKYNKKKLPFIIATLVFCLLTYILYLVPWFEVEIGNDLIIRYNVYQTLIVPINSGANFGNVSLFAIGFLIQGAAISYIFIDSKGLGLTIKILNLAYLAFAALNFAMVCSMHWVAFASTIWLFTLSLVLCVLQFALPAFRKTH